MGEKLRIKMRDRSSKWQQREVSMIMENSDFSSLLNNGNKKFKNKITRSSTFKNRALQNFIKRIKEIKPGSPYQNDAEVRWL